MPPTLSVIVPVYKTEPYRRQCVDSILGQTYPHLEVILVNDGSPDDCGKICEDYSLKDPRVKVCHQMNSGQAVARNTGLRLATGEYVTFVDSDDWLDPGLYAELMAQAPFQMLIYGCTTTEEATGHVCALVPIERSHPISWGEDDIALHHLFSTSLFGYAVNKIHHRSILDGITFRDIKLREDLLFALEASHNADRIHTSQCAGYFYRIHAQSTLRSTFSGSVPDIVGTAKAFFSIHPSLPKGSDRDISNDIIKSYIIDALYKFVFLNSSLSPRSRLAVVREIIHDQALKKHLRFQPKDSFLFFILTFSFKAHAPLLLYYVLKRIWTP